jgi:two-component system, NtrC family, sensor kinase
MNRDLQNRSLFRSSLKLRIIIVIGSIISLLMILISIGALIQWRALILDQQKDNAMSFARAFSIPVIEILINTEQDKSTGADLLETHIQNFIENVEGILYVSIADINNRIVAHSDLSYYGLEVSDPDLVRASATKNAITRIFMDNDSDTWVLEALQPLQIGEKRWGTVTLGFDASSTREKISSSFFLLLSLTLLAILITLGMLYYFISKIMASLRDFVAEVDKINLVDTQPMAIKTRTDEIGFLIEHFEMMKKRLAESKTELENAQHQIYQAEKLASIGRLASGVAHEVNNPLNGMRFCVYGIQNDPENHEQTRQYLALINEGLEQIESVVTKLLGYSRQRPKTPEVIQPEKPVKVVLDLLKYRINEKNVQVTIDQAPDLPTLKADPNLIQEMLMNLILNSLDAVGDNGKIAIGINKSGPGNLELTVFDNGMGIPDDEQEKIFDPFYTTKDTGKGTGLGLSVTLGIVEAHNGTIRVQSQPGAGTTFTITLPAEEK